MSGLPVAAAAASSADGQEAAAPASGAAAAAEGQPPVANVQFRLNGVLLRREVVDLPGTPEEFRELAALLPDSDEVRPRGAVEVVGYLGQPGEAQDVLALKDRKKIKAFWAKVARCEVGEARVRVSGATQPNPPGLHMRLVPVVGVLLAIAFPALANNLSSQDRLVAVFGRKALDSVLARGGAAEAPKDQMTSFAVANLQSTQDADNEFLCGMLMEDARSYSKSVLFEADSANRRVATLNALSNTNLPDTVVEKIGNLMGNTTLLVDQFSDFSLSADGKAISFSVNVWASREKPDTRRVDVALMISGAEFKRGMVKAVQEVEEPQFREYQVRHEATLFSPAKVEYIKEPLTVDGKTQLTRKVIKPVFDNTQVKPQEMEIIRRYLLTLSSHDTLRNYAPGRIPSWVKSPRLIAAPAREGGGQVDSVGIAAAPEGLAEERRAF